MVEIIVNGAAERALGADRAQLALSFAQSGSEREPVVRAVAERHAALVARAAQLVDSGSAMRYLADPIESYSTTWQREDGQSAVEHHARANVSIELAELGLVGELTLELAAAGVDAHVSWELSDEVRRSMLGEVRAEALADAHRAAEDYARATGASELELLTLRDAPSGAQLMQRMKAFDAPAAEVTVRDVAVRVELEATFRAH